VDRIEALAARLPAYPVLLAVAYVMNLALVNDVEPAGFVRPLVVAIAGSLVLLAVTSAIARSWRAGAALALVALCLLASREPLVQVISLLNRTVGPGVGILVLAGLTFVVLVALAVLVLRIRGWTGRALARLTAVLNVMALLFLVLVLAAGVPQIPTWLATPGETAENPDPELPDIFLILLDGYPRSDVLLDDFGIDNSAFLRELRSRSFAVSASSHSNYTFTALTMTSILQLDYLSVGLDGREVVAQHQVRAEFDAAALHGRVPEALRAAGYEFVASAPGWEHVSLRSAVERYLDRPELSDLELNLLKRTWIPDLPGVSEDWFISEQRSRVNGIFEQATSLSTEHRARPIFAFVHIPSPHMPIVFGREGRPVPWGSRQFGAGVPAEYGLSDAEFSGAYEQQLDYLNDRTLDLVDAILGGARPAAVVIFSDHGSSPRPYPDPRSLLPNLMAAYVPDGELQESDLADVLHGISAVLTRYVDLHLGAGAPRHWIASEEDRSIVIEESSPSR